LPLPKKPVTTVTGILRICTVKLLTLERVKSRAGLRNRQGNFARPLANASAVIA
jgi:hypothetical protein